MYSKPVLENGFTAKRFVNQTVLIILVSGTISAAIATLDWDLRILFIFCQFVGLVLFSTISMIRSRLTQFWVLIIIGILVGFIPFLFLTSYCYFHVESNTCRVN